MNGQSGVGVGVLLLTCGFLFAATQLLFSPVFLFLFVGFGMWLVGVHYHAYLGSLRRAVGIDPPLTGFGLTFLLLFVIYLQLFGFATVMSGNRTAVDLYANWFQPVFASGDRMILETNLRVNAVAKGDVVMVNNQFMERVIALPGERLEVRQQVVLVDGKPAIERGFEPLMERNAELRLFPAATDLARILKAPIGDSVVILPDHIGILRAGKPEAIPLSRILGRVVSIVWPLDRRRQIARRS